MVAMMICGIHPVPGCTSIPDQALSLVQATRAATRSELDNARYVLKEWLLYKFSDEGGDFPLSVDVADVLATPIDSYEFCVDCEDAGLRPRAPFLMEFIGVGHVDEAYLTAAAKRATELHEHKKKNQWEQDQLHRPLRTNEEPESKWEEASTSQLNVRQGTKDPSSRRHNGSTRGRPNRMEVLISAAENDVGTLVEDRARVLYARCLELAKQNPRFCPGMTLRVETYALYFTLDGSEVERPYGLRLISQRVRRQNKADPEI